VVCVRVRCVVCVWCVWCVWCVCVVRVRYMCGACAVHVRCVCGAVWCVADLEGVVDGHHLEMAAEGKHNERHREEEIKL
jgi:hypothetical protein